MDLKLKKAIQKSFSGILTSGLLQPNLINYAFEKFYYKINFINYNINLYWFTNNKFNLCFIFFCCINFYNNRTNKKNKI